MRDGRGFLLSITMTELLILLFFLLLLLASSIITRLFSERDDALAQYHELEAATQWREGVSDDDFFELLRDAYQLSTLREQVNTLKDAAARASRAESLLAMLPSRSTIDSLRLRERVLLGQMSNLQRRCGNDYPPCWVVDDGTGRPEYIYDILILDDRFIIRPSWPPHRETSVDLIPGARELVGEYTDFATFRRKAAPVLDWARAQEPECRLFVKIRDRASMKEPFLDRMTTIEEYFYKFLIRKH